jgi:predicted DNA-binding protein YlxM (UPF0122 family)
MNPVKLRIKPCKFCGEKFQQKFSPLEAFCRSLCQSAYTKEKDYSKVKVVHNKYSDFPPKKINIQEHSEKDVFFKIWSESNKTSFVTGKILSDPINARAWYFSHVLAKGQAKYPMFKYYAKNIVLKEFKEHEIWEYKQSGIIDNPLWNHVFKLKEELLEEYKEHLKLFKQGCVEYYKI